MIKKKMNARWLATLLTFVMIFGLLPANVFAADSSEAYVIDSNAEVTPSEPQQSHASESTESPETEPPETEPSEAEPTDPEYPTYEYPENEGTYDDNEYDDEYDQYIEEKLDYPEDTCDYPEYEYADGYENDYLAAVYLNEVIEPATTSALEQLITVYMSLEGFTLGHGFYIEPTAITVPSGSSAMDATVALLEANNLTHAGGNAISRIYGLNAGVANPPDFIMAVINALDGTEQWGTTFTFNPNGSADGSLGNNDYFTFSGWMFTLNHVMPAVGADQVTLSDGAVIRWQFSMLMGDDLGFGWGYPPLYTHTNKTELIRALFAPGVTAAARQNALNVIIDPLATAEEVAAALGALTGQTPPLVDMTALNTAIAQAQSRQQADYTPASWAQLQAALAAALTLSEAADQTTVDQAAVDQAADRLLAALDALIPCSPSELPDWQTAMSGSLAWLRSAAPNPSFEDVSEWAIIALARAGIADNAWFDSYLSALENTLITPANESSGPSSVMDYARITLALTALGKNAANFSGRNLTQSFATFNPTLPNADIWALIALNSRPYTGAQLQYVTAILNAQTPNGAWAFGAWESVDLTSMAIQALAPYYNNNAAVTTAIGNALDWIEGQWITSPEEYAQVVIALASLGYNPSDYVTSLLAFYDPVTGGFKSATWEWEGITGGGIVNQMSTEQGAHALVAYYRFVNNMNPLFDMSDAGPGETPLPTPTPTPTPTPPPDNGDTGSPNDGTVSISVRDGTRVFFYGSFVIAPGETPYSLLRRTGLDVRSRSGYVYSINGLAEFDAGPLSGWMYRVNGLVPGTIAATQFPLRANDRVEWLFTRDLGADIGGDAFDDTGAAAPGQESSTEAGRVITEIAAVVADGAAIAQVRFNVIRDLIAEALAEDARNIHITVTQTDETNRVELLLTAESIQAIATNNMSLTLHSDMSTLTFDTATLDGLAYGANGDTQIRIIAEIITENSDITLTPAQRHIVGDNKVFSLVVMIGDQVIRNFNGSVTVEMPYTPPTGFPVADRDLLTVYHLDGGANFREMMGAEFGGGSMTFTTSHFSLFFISEWISPFEDISRADWFFRSVRFLYSQGLMDDMGYGLFLPDTDITLGEIATLLWQMAGAPISMTIAAAEYSPLVEPAGPIYYNALSWAIAKGIIGYNSDPDDTVTLTQLAVILHGYANYKGFDTVTDDYAARDLDLSGVSPWAVDAIKWAKPLGIVVNFREEDFTEESFAFETTVSRSETAVIFQQFIEFLND